MLREPRPLAWAVNSPNRHWLVVGTVCVGAFMGQLDASIVTLALPRMSHDFRASIGSVEWVALSYLLILVSTVTAVGRLADMIGRKLLYTYGFGVFVAGSALCGLAPSLGWLVVARVLQAVGASMLQANSVALITHAMPADKLGRGIGAQGAAQATGLALGPAVGGALIALAGWRSIFFVNVPAGLLGMTLGWLLLPVSEDRGERGRFDWGGAMLLTPAVALGMAVLSFGRSLGWGSPPLLTLLAGGVALTLAFVRRERRHHEPLLDLKLFARMTFSMGIASGLLSYLVLFGVLFVVPFFLSLRHVDAATSGLWLAALPVALGLVAPTAGRLADTLGPRLMTTTGMLITAGGLAWLALDPHRGPALIAALAVIGAGLGTFTPANNAAIMASAPRRQAGVASGVLNMTRGLGTALGVAIASLVYATAAGLGANALQASRSAAEHGLIAAAAVLAVLAVLAMALSSLRGQHLDLRAGYG